MPSPSNYVDLYLIHAPWPWAPARHGSLRRQRRGVARHGGDPRQRARQGDRRLELQRERPREARRDARETPQVNQIRWFIGHTQDDVVEYGKQHGILTEAYSPLATGALIDNADLQAIADKYGKTVAQVAIRYALQKDTLPLPKTTTPSRIVENADVDFELSADDVTYLDGLENVTR